jgi:DNA replication protein DnaC
MNIPTLNELVDRGRAFNDIDPTGRTLENVKRFFAKAGFRRELSPKIFDILTRWGAKEIEGLNHRGLLLRGGCGIGKTYGISVLANLLRFPVVNAKELENNFLSLSQEEFDNLVDADNCGMETRCIAIDDIGVESSPVVKFGTSCNVLECAIDRRYREGFLRQRKHTILTTNLSDEALQRKYGLRILDRLDEMVEFYTIQGESLRRGR